MATVVPSAVRGYITVSELFAIVNIMPPEVLIMWPSSFSDDEVQKCYKYDAAEGRLAPLTEDDKEDGEMYTALDIKHSGRVATPAGAVLRMLLPLAMENPGAIVVQNDGAHHTLAAISFASARLHETPVNEGYMPLRDIVSTLDALSDVDCLSHIERRLDSASGFVDLLRLALTQAGVDGRRRQKIIEYYCHSSWYELYLVKPRAWYIGSDAVTEVYPGAVQLSPTAWDRLFPRICTSDVGLTLARICIYTEPQMLQRFGTPLVD